MFSFPIRCLSRFRHGFTHVNVSRAIDHEHVHYTLWDCVWKMPWNFPYLLLLHVRCTSILLVMHTNLPLLTSGVPFLFSKDQNCQWDLPWYLIWGTYFQTCIGTSSTSSNSKEYWILNKEGQRQGGGTEYKKLEEGCYLEFKKRVMQFTTLASQTNVPVSTNVIIAKALNEKQNILKDQCTTAKQELLHKFSSYKGWVINYVSRHGLRVLDIHKKLTSVNKSAVVEEISILRKILSDYSLGTIYNVKNTSRHQTTSA